MNSSLVAAFVVYFLILLSIGLLAHRRQSSSADFILGSRSLNFWLTALSAHASDMGAWLFMAFPAAIFLNGLPQLWVAIGLILGMFCNWHFVAKKLRTSTEQYGCYTLSTFFERRFQDTSGTIRVLTALMMVFFLTSYLSAGLIAMGRIFEPVFQIDYRIGVTVAALVAMVYTFTGGFITVAWTDLFQALFLLVMVLLVPIVAFFQLPGGFAEIIATADKNRIPLTLLPDYSLISILGALFLMLGWGLGYFGQPHIITKFMGIREAEEMYKSKYLGISWQILALVAAVCVGLVGMAFFSNGLKLPELVFVNMVQSLFHPFAAGIILCGVIAANMSSMDSQLLVCASVLSEDLYKRLTRRHPSSKELLRASRVAVILVSFVALGLAFNQNATVLEVVFYAWSGLGSAFGPLVLMSLYSSSTNKFGAIAGIVVGGVVAAIWPMINPFVSSMEILSMVPGFSLSLLSIYVVSQLTSVRNGAPDELA